MSYALRFARPFLKLLTFVCLFVSRFLLFYNQHTVPCFNNMCLVPPIFLCIFVLLSISIFHLFSPSITLTLPLPLVFIANCSLHVLPMDLISWEQIPFSFVIKPKFFCYGLLLSSSLFSVVAVCSPRLYQFISYIGKSKKATFYHYFAFPLLFSLNFANGCWLHYSQHHRQISFRSFGLHSNNKKTEKKLERCMKDKCVQPETLGPQTSENFRKRNC